MNHSPSPPWLRKKDCVLLTVPPERIKQSTRKVYQRLARACSTNLSRVPLPDNKSLARSLGYEPSGLPIPEAAWDLFAGCGYPHESMKLGPDWTVLDLGCGAGIDCYIAALELKPPGRVIGLDYTPDLIQLASTYTPPELRDRCTWLVADGEDLPIRRGCIDLAFANGSFNLLPGKEHFLAEVHRVLVPGGTLIVTDLVRVGKLGILGEVEDAWPWCVAGALSPGEYDQLLAGTGFSRWQLRLTHEYGPLAGALLVAHKA
jgi:arsenite methyltransferase